VKYKDVRKPGRTIIIPPTAWAETWPKRPQSDVAAGLRRLSEWDLQLARAEAVKAVLELYPEDEPFDSIERDHTFNDMLIVEAIAKALTDPNDVNKSYFEAPEDETREALTSDFLRKAYDELVAMQRTGSLSEPEITQAQAAALASQLVAGVGSLHPSVRRALHSLYVELVPEEAREQAVAQDEL
jgi:hypothetical protein